MKKTSTAATIPSRNISRQKLTIGLDLGDRNSWYCVLDEAGQMQLEQRVRTTAQALQEVFGVMPRSRIALEIGTHSPWISRVLSELGDEVIAWRIDIPAGGCSISPAMRDSPRRTPSLVRPSLLRTTPRAPRVNRCYAHTPLG